MRSCSSKSEDCVVTETSKAGSRDCHRWLGNPAAGTMASTRSLGFGEVTTGRQPIPFGATLHEMAKVTDEGGNLDFVRHVYVVRLDVPAGATTRPSCSSPS